MLDCFFFWVLGDFEEWGMSDRGVVLDIALNKLAQQAGSDKAAYGCMCVCVCVCVYVCVRACICVFAFVSCSISR